MHSSISSDGCWYDDNDNICSLLSFYLYNNGARTVVLRGLKHSRNRGDCPKGHY